MQQKASLPKPVTTFATGPCITSLVLHNLHLSPNNRLPSFAPTGSIKTKGKHGAKQLPQQWFHHNWQGSLVPLRVAWRRMSSCPTKSIRHHSPLRTYAQLAGGVVNSPSVRWFPRLFSCSAGWKRAGCIVTIDPCMKKEVPRWSGFCGVMLRE